MNDIPNDVKLWIKGHEKLMLKPYRDTVGKLTIGYGNNIEDGGITKDEAEFMFENDFNAAVKDLSQYSWYLNQPDNVKYALINMCFNLGIGRLLGFRKMIQALIDKNYTLAAKEALSSKWANQVGDRAKDVAIMIRQG